MIMCLMLTRDSLSEFKVEKAKPDNIRSDQPTSSEVEKLGWS